MREIHPTALVDARAELADDVKVGAYSIIAAGVTVGPGTVVQEHCHLHGNLIIGERCKIGPAAYLGLSPQHLKHDGAGAYLIIGDDVVIREMVSAHRGITPGAEHATRIGDRCYLMAASHVGHDAQIGNDVTLGNNALIAGHVQLGNKVFIGGGTGIHQFVRVGRLTMVAGNESFSHDVPPFAAVRYGRLKGYNAIGCKRAGISAEAISSIRRAFHALHIHRTLPAALQAIKEGDHSTPELQEILNFVASSKRGILPSRITRDMRVAVDDD